MLRRGPVGNAADQASPGVQCHARLGVPCGTLLADLNVHPRVAMQILRHAQFSITMEIYTQVSRKSTRDALKRLGDSLGGPADA
jgi:hypothetical protein